MAAVPTSPEFDRLKSFARSLMSQKQWDASSLVALGGSLAGEVNKISSLSGPQKKQLVLDVVKSVFQEAVEKASPASPLASAETVKSLTFVLDFAVPASLDLAVAAARGQLDLKKVKKTAVAGCLACLPFLMKSAGASAQQAAIVETMVKNAVAEPAEPESDKSNPPPETTGEKGKEKEKEKADDTETPPRENSHEGGMVLRVPEATPQPASQTS
jgi:hypothetical protein